MRIVHFEFSFGISSPISVWAKCELSSKSQIELSRVKES